MVLFIGDDWAEDHHDVEIQDDQGRRLVRARLAEGIAGISRLHELVAQLDGGTGETAPTDVLIGIETDRGPWVTALVAAGYTVFAVNPRQVARYRERHSVSRAKSDAGDAHALADMVRTDAHQLRPVAGDSALVEGIKLVARAHQTLVWERQRHVMRLRATLRDFFPAALAAFDDLAGADTVELLTRAPDPASAARLSLARITAALRRARRHHATARAEQIQAALRAEQLELPAKLVAANAAIVRTVCPLIAAFNTQIAQLQHVQDLFDQHPDAEIYRSQPGLGEILGARALGEFGDAPDRFPGAQARKNYAGTSPITRASGGETRRHRAAGPQQPARRPPAPASVLRAHQLTRSSHVLRPDPRPRHQPSRRIAPGVQPARRHPAWLPGQPNPLRRAHGMAAPVRQ